MINQVFHRDSIAATPWKNGGGVTREIAKSESADPYWRLSIADVGQEGPFSKFANLSRILTVIDGIGMVLQFMDKTMSADLHKPVHFSGEDSVVGLLPNGPIQDFNLIYDADFYHAEVSVISSHNQALPRSKTLAFHAMYCLSGSAHIEVDRLLPSHSGIINPTKPVLPSAEEKTLLLDVMSTPE